MAVAAHRARSAGVPFDSAAQSRRVRDLQDRFLSSLAKRGIDFAVTETTLHLASGEVRRPNRFEFLIDAVGLRVPSVAVPIIRRLPGVKHVAADKPRRLVLDKSVAYIRASDSPGNKTIFFQGGSGPKRFDGTGQVIAIIDSGIDRTHPMFDTRFGDDAFQSRIGDARPVRMSGASYVEGTHHPKVVYALNLAAGDINDDLGHGTHVAADAAGMKVKAPGPDGVPGNADDKIIEGVAPGALLMNYKACAATTACDLDAIIGALEDAMSSRDSSGNPKPIATVINMSLGSDTGDPNEPDSVAADNAALAGAAVIAAAGNSGSAENTVGAPAAARRVIAVAASNDPGVTDTGELDVLGIDDARYTSGAGTSTGAQNDFGRPVAPEDRPMAAFLMVGAPGVSFPLGQHYVYAGQANTADQVPTEVNGRIALVQRGTSTFATKASNVAAKGAVAALIFNNVDGELNNAQAAGATIPVYGVSKANGEYLRDALGFRSLSFNKDDSSTWGTISNFPLRIQSAFRPDTAGFSSRGPIDDFSLLKPDVTAPGVDIYSATVVAGVFGDPSRYASASGTSFSTPHVSGSAALVRQALLDERGQPPLSAANLRLGQAASAQQAQNGIVTPSFVRAALTGTATNLRDAGQMQIPDGEDRTLIHEIGSGLIDVAQAIDARVAIGTNSLDSNRLRGPDDGADADFLSTYSFGEQRVINSNLPVIRDRVTITLENLSGATGGGTYSLSPVDGGGLSGGVTRPIIGTSGFSVSLSASTVTLGGSAGDRATFDVEPVVDGRPSPTGLAAAGIDVNGINATEFLWWVVATGSNGEVVRMPFYFRAVEGFPILDHPDETIRDDQVPDQIGGVDHDGRYRLTWDFPPPPSRQPCGFQILEATSLATHFTDDAEESLSGGSNSKWTGDPNWVSATHPNTNTKSYSVLYTDNLDVSLTAKNLVAIPPGTSAALTFDSAQDLEPGFDFGFVEASANGGPFETLDRFTGFFSGRGSVDLSKFAGKTVKVRFRFTSDEFISAPIYDGWFIDNIKIESGAFSLIGEVDESTFSFDVPGRSAGNYYYRVRPKFFDCVGTPYLGPASNIESVRVDLSATNLWFPWYDGSHGIPDWIVVNNTSGSRLTARVLIGPRGALADVLDDIEEGKSWTPQFPGVTGGPVNVIVSGPAVASIRSLWGSNGTSNFEEVLGTPDSAVPTTHYWPWYDGVSTGGRDWVHVVNPGTEPANVSLKIGTTPVWTETVPPGENRYFNSEGLVGGPVVLTSDKPVLSSQRVLWGDINFSETPGMSLTQDAWFSWYDARGSDGQDWIVVGNPGDLPVTVDITIGDRPPTTHQVPPKSSIFPTFPDVMGGPVHVVSSGGPVVVSQRAIWDGWSMEEVAGSNARSGGLFTWYDTVATGDKDWILVANIGATADAKITIAGDLVFCASDTSTFCPEGFPKRGALAHGEIVTPVFSGKQGGPVEVIGSAGSSLIISRRTLWGPRADFTEVLPF